LIRPPAPGVAVTGGSTLMTELHSGILVRERSRSGIVDDADDIAAGALCGFPERPVISGRSREIDTPGTVE